MTVLKYLLAVVMAMLIFTGCGLGSGPSESEVKEGIANALISYEWNCSSISKTLAVEDISYHGSSERLGSTYYYVKAHVNYRCHMNSDPAGYEDEFKLRREGEKWVGAFRN